MKKLLVVFMLLSGQVQAQMDPLQALYVNNHLVINPAYTGFTKDLNLTASYRKQWAGFDGNPETLIATGHMALHKNKMGAGLVFLSDKIGSNAQKSVQGTYAYHLPLDNNTTLSFGLQAGAINYRTDYSDLVVNPNDPKLTSTNEWQPNFGAGLMLTNDRYFLSISAPKMLKPSTESAAQGLYSRNMNIMASYAFTVSSRVRLRPYALYRASANSESSYDLGVNLLGDDSYLVGVFTRRFHTYGLMAQLKLDELLRIGYAFELPTNQSAGLQYTSHEIQIIVRMITARFHDLGAVKNF